MSYADIREEQERVSERADRWIYGHWGNWRDWFLRVGPRYGHSCSVHFDWDEAYYWLCVNLFDFIDLELCTSRPWIRVSRTEPW